MKHDGFCMQNHGVCMKHDGFCMQNDGVCIQNDEYSQTRRRFFRPPTTLDTHQVMNIPSNLMNMGILNDLNDLNDLSK